jgi:hypothetical protein
VFGELIEQVSGCGLSSVVAGDQGEDDELLVALGAVAGPDMLNGAGDSGLGEGN